MKETTLYVFKTSLNLKWNRNVFFHRDRRIYIDHLLLYKPVAGGPTSSGKKGENGDRQFHLYLWLGDSFYLESEKNRGDFSWSRNGTDVYVLLRTVSVLPKRTIVISRNFDLSPDTNQFSGVKTQKSVIGPSSEPSRVVTRSLWFLVERTNSLARRSRIRWVSSQTFSLSGLLFDI